MIREPNSITCQVVGDSLVALVAQELPAQLAADLRAHLQHCLSCRAEWHTLEQAQALSTELQLTIPAVDRYPEFLRRLAATEANRSALIRAESQGINTLQEAQSPPGLAAIVPLFGHRLYVRSGFGGGFDLRLTARTGRELLHIAAHSLTKAAAFVGGVSFLAVGTIALLLWASASLFRATAPPTSQTPSPPAQGKSELPWTQSASGTRWSLVFWANGSQVQASWRDRSSQSASAAFTFALPPALEVDTTAPALNDCAAATDGDNFLVVRAVSSSILVWRVTPSLEISSPLPPPLALSFKGAQPAVAWAGDRYLAVWIEPDATMPRIKLLEVGSDGQPLTNEPVTVAETEQGRMVGSPGVVARRQQAMILYQVQGGTLLAKFWAASTGLQATALRVARHRGLLVNRPLLLANDDAYFVCWGESLQEGAEARWVQIKPQTEVSSPRTLVSSSWPITQFDATLGNHHLALLWAEAKPRVSRFWQQRFSLTGDPLRSANALQSPQDINAAPTWGDANGDFALWPAPHRSSAPLVVQAIQ